MKRTSSDGAAGFAALGRRLDRAGVIFAAPWLPRRGGGGLINVRASFYDIYEKRKRLGKQGVVKRGLI